MIWWWCGYRRQRSNRCRTRAFPGPRDRRVTWSTKRGDCRFDEGHDGPCKPKKR